jgi:hypothetical protein
VNRDTKQPIVGETVTFKLAGTVVTRAKTDVRGSIRFTDDNLRAKDELEVVVGGESFMVELEVGANKISHQISK